MILRVKREIKKVSDKQKLIQFINTKPIFKEMLKSLLFMKNKSIQQEATIYKEGKRSTSSQVYSKG